MAQSTGGLKGRVVDPNGAVIAGASVTLSGSGQTLTTQSGKEGEYDLKTVPVGSYTLAVTAPGFQPYSNTDIVIETDRTRRLNVPLAIATQHQTIKVQNNSTVGVNPDQNASALVLKGHDLDALSNIPSQLRNELLALAGPGAGPNGTQILVNGFPGGPMPPKSAIQSIRINQNPFSARYARPGYGRIDIITKPGARKFSGQVFLTGNDSSWNTGVPLAGQRPSYYFYNAAFNTTGPITKQSAYLLELYRWVRQSQSIIDAVDPSNPEAGVHGTFPNPFALNGVYLTLDFQVSKNNTLSVVNDFWRTATSGDGVGQLNLPEQATRTKNFHDAVQIIDTEILNPHLVVKTRFQYRRDRTSQISSYFTPTVTVQGAFTTGGSSSGVVRDHQDDYVLNPEAIVTTSKHTVQFGAQLHAYRDANESTAGSNGAYFFSTLDQYEATTPALYQVTVVHNPLARAILFDGALFVQDDWKARSNLTVSSGLRFETQNRIDDHADWAPRFAIAWAPGQHGKKPAKTVLRAGYGWFYDRFIAANSTLDTPETPYIMKAIHQNGINQQSYVIANPDFYNPDTPVPPAGLANMSISIPSIYSIDPHFHAALDMLASVGVDRQIGKNSTLNVSYRYTRGVHQYLTNNVTAPKFDPTTYTIVSPPPSLYNYQFQSGGVYKQHQVVVTANVKLHRLTLHGTYTWNHAKSDTQSVNYFPSVAQDPGLDYGRASFANRHRLTVLGDYTAPYGIKLSSMFAAQSGTPYNLTIGSDLTGNNQFNARPTYGVCGAPDVISTQYGCLDANPVGKREKIVPYGLGVGPANFVTEADVRKTFGFGPKAKGGKSAGRYNLTLLVAAVNLFNVVNLGPPNGTLNSPLFGKSQSLAKGIFGPATAGNRTIIAQAFFTF